jgi:hypothetical protein
LPISREARSFYDWTTLGEAVAIKVIAEIIMRRMSDVIFLGQKADSGQLSRMIIRMSGFVSK